MAITNDELRRIRSESQVMMRRLSILVIHLASSARLNIHETSDLRPDISTLV